MRFLGVSERLREQLEIQERVREKFNPGWRAQAELRPKRKWGKMGAREILQRLAEEGGYERRRR